MADSVASWVDEESKKRDSEWTRERSEEKKKKSKESSIELKTSSAVKHLTKRLKAIYEDEGLDFGGDVDEETIVDRFAVATKTRKKRVAEVFRLIRRSRNVELCFLVDATGSMQPHIDGVRESINKIIKKLTDKGPHVSFKANNGKPEVQDLKLSFVAYRDHGDTNQFEVLTFTDSATKFRDFRARISASGGGDAPEDVFGGLEKAMHLNWTDNAGTKVLFHIADAPCHGKEFHNDLSDSHPTGDPKGRTHQALFSHLKERGIQYFFGKINNSTDLMIKKFTEV